MSTNVLMAIMAREGKIRVTNLLFIFWDLFYPLGYLLVFGMLSFQDSLGEPTKVPPRPEGGVRGPEAADRG